MEVTRLSIDGALEIVPKVFRDDRGWFKETYARSRYLPAGIDADFVQDNLSMSDRFVLRGLHGAPRMGKLVQVLSGSAYDVIVDVRTASPTFMRWHAVMLRANEHHQLYIPAGCVHGFLALEDETLLYYKQSSEYDPAAELGIDGGGLVGGHARAAAKGHVLLGMGSAREAGRGLIAAHVKIKLDRSHRSQRIAHDDDLQAIRQRGSRDRAGAGSGVQKGGAGGKQEQQRQQGF